MATNTNQFLVSVADVVMRDTTADTVVLKGKTLINSAFKQAVQSTEIAGGFGSSLLYDYSHSKRLTVTVEDGKFDESFIAINNGVLINTGAQNFYIFDEAVTLTGGSGTTAQTPVGNLYVQKPDNTIVTITPTGSNFSVSGLTNQTVYVTYRYSVSVGSITIDASNYPHAYELTMSSRIFQGSGQTATMQIVIPQFKLSGNFDLTFTNNGVSTNKLDGKALLNPSDNSYAYVRILPTGGAAPNFTALAVSPGSVSLSATNTTQQLTVIGVQSGVNANVVNPSGTTFASSVTATATVNASGLITRVAAGTTNITVTNGSLTDTVVVTCT